MDDEDDGALDPTNTATFRVSNTLQNVLARLSSGSAVERKRSAEELMEILGYPDTQDLLNFNTLAPESSQTRNSIGNITWNSVFIEVRNHLEKILRTVKPGPVHAQAFNLFKIVIDQAQAYESPYLNLNAVFTFIYELIYNDAKIASMAGLGFVQIIYNILSSKPNLSFIDSGSWKGLLLLLIKLYRTTKLPKPVLLETLKIVIVNASNYPTIIPNLRKDLIEFFQTALTEDSTNSLLFQGATLLCSQNALEFRGILCKFGEEIIEKIHFPTNNDLDESIIEFILVQLRLHSPCDVTICSAGFYAYNRPNWVESLESIYAFCVDAIESIARKRGYTNASISTNMLTLAVKITNQVSGLSHSSSSLSHPVSSPPKRLMTQKSFSTVINNTVLLPASEIQLLWLSYITAVLRSFPELVQSTSTVDRLFRISMNLLNSSFSLRPELHTFLLSLYHAEQYILKSKRKRRHLPSTEIPAPSSTPWYQVWDIVIRSLMVQGEQSESSKCPEILELLRSLLVEIGQDMDLSLMLNLFLNHSLGPSEKTVNLLIEFLSRCNLPQFVPTSQTTRKFTLPGQTNKSCPRIALMDWIITSLMPKMLSNTEEKLGNLLCALIFHRSHVYLQSVYPKSRELVIFEENINEPKDFEEVLLDMSFVNLAEKYGHGSSRYEGNKRQNKFRILDNAACKICPLLEEDLLQLPPIDKKSPDFIKKLSYLQHRIKIILTLANSLESICLDFNGDLKETLLNLLVSSLQRYMSNIIDHLSTQKIQVSGVLAALKSLFSTSVPFSDELKQLISESCLMPIRDFWISTCLRGIKAGTISSNEFENDDDETGNGKLEKLRHEHSLQALRVLILFSNYLDEGGRFQLFAELYQIVGGSMKSFHSLNQFYFDITIELLQASIPIFTENLFRSLHKDIPVLLQALCRHYNSNPEYCTKLWKFFHDIGPLMAKDSDQVDFLRYFMILVHALAQRLETTNSCCIPLVKAKLQAFAHFAKNDPLLLWTNVQHKQDATVTVKSIYLNIREYFNKNSQQIRISLLNLFWEIFRSEQRNQPKIDHTLLSRRFPEGSSTKASVLRKAIYEEAYSALMDLCDVTINLSQDELNDETRNRTSVVISCLTNLVFLYPFNQRRTLFSLLLIVKLKNLDTELTNSALKYFCSEPSKTLSFHLLYMLGKWLKLKYRIEEFPYQLYGYNNYGEFATKYRKEISFQCFVHSNEGEGDQCLITNFAKTMNTTKLKLVEESFGLLLGRLLPGVGESDMPGPSSQIKQVNLTRSALQKLTTLFGGNTSKEFQRRVHHFIHEIFLHVISCTYQPDIMDRWCCTLRIPEPQPPFLDEEKTKYVLEYELKEHLNWEVSDNSVLDKLIRTSGRSIFLILESLLLQIHESHDELEKFWRLHQYAFFIKLLLSHSKETILSGHLQSYISETVAYSYIRLLNPKSHQPNFVNAVLHVFCDFIKSICLLFQDEMKALFRPIIHQLVSISSVVSSAKLFEILHYLMLTSGSTYSESIANLAPFPETMEFEPYRKVYVKCKYNGLEHLGQSTWSLEKELSSSLEILENFSGNSSISTIELLKFVKVKLSERKPELEQMVTKFGSFRFSDECKNSVLHNLIRVLIDVVKRSQDENVKLEACRCLGEIGPIDLGLLVLPNNSKNHVIVNVLSTIELVHTYLLNEDINLVIKSTSVLQDVFKLKESVLQICSKGNEKLALKLRPFLTSSTGNASLVLTGSVPATLESKLASIANSEYISFSNWIRDLTLGIISSLLPNSNFFQRIVPLCERKIDFCQELLPFLVYSCLKSSINIPLVRESLSKYFQKFFCHFTSATSANCGVNDKSSLEQLEASFGGESQESEAVGSIYTNKRAIRTLIDTVQFLRNHQIPVNGKTPWENNFWLDVNYLDLAKAAQYCGAFLTTILYSEIHAYGLRDPGQVYSLQHDSQSTTSSRTHAEVDKLLLKAYISIGETDAVYGCGSARYSDLSSNLQHLEQLNQWNRALSAYDCQVSEPETAQLGMCRSLKEQGLLHTLWTLMDGVERQGCNSGRVLDPKLEEIRYECAWRLSKWDFNSDKPSHVPGTFQLIKQQAFQNLPSLQKPLYESLQSGFTMDRAVQEASMSKGFLNIAQDLKHSSIQSSENLYNFLTQFQMFRVVEDFFDLVWSGERLEQLTTTWKLQNCFSAKDLKFQEPILSLERVVLQSFIETQQKSNDLILVNALDNITLQLITSARHAGRLEIAENLVSEIIGPNMRSRKEIEVAKNHWARGESDIAMLRLLNLIKLTAIDRGSDLYPAALMLYGEWLVEKSSESPSVVLEKYFLPGVCFYESGKAHASVEDIANAHIVLAKYADSLYQSVNNYVKLEDFQEKERNLAKLRQEHDSLKAEPLSNDQRKTLITLEKHIYLDTAEISNTTSEIAKYLNIALKHYLLGLKKSSSRHDLLIFRAVGLWLENIDKPDTTKAILEEQLPSYKYVAVLHQLTARLGIFGVQEALNTIITKCTQEHPHHSLPVLLSLVSMNKDKDFLKGPNVKKNNEQTSRIQAARKILDTVKKSGHNDLVTRMEALWVSLISLANYQVEARSTDFGTRHIPDNAPIRKLKTMERISIPTTTIDVSPTGTYQGIIGIGSFNMEFNLVGGINSPKRISCLGTDGKAYNMLLKGQDDLRQDQVMQQVFGVMNQLLKNETASKSRRLHIRTYKVVPLSQRSGIIEWVENTTTFGEYLLGGEKKLGAHRKYRPMDYNPIVARKKMNDVKDFSKKLEVFNDILQNFKPVFRHFFFENFKEPGTFFERRLAYTRSVSTSSMVGYILGLGDRHVLNILVDKTTAEFVHIDFGVAFEQGKILPTPETIPFRLTRDVVDGMGLCGIEGDFRRCCEITLGVLRNNNEIIHTILQVLLYDPLYFWTLSSDRAQKIQPTDSSIRRSGPVRRSLAHQQQGQTDSPVLDETKEKNTSASRVLLRLKQKLLGVEEGLSSGVFLSVPGHVALLIQRAMDPARLSRLFPGWQPYL